MDVCWKVATNHWLLLWVKLAITKAVRWWLLTQENICANASRIPRCNQVWVIMSNCHKIWGMVRLITITIFLKVHMKFCKLASVKLWAVKLEAEDQLYQLWQWWEVLANDRPESGCPHNQTLRLSVDPEHGSRSELVMTNALNKSSKLLYYHLLIWCVYVYACTFSILIQLALSQGCTCRNT
jgi:hypothetical protein